MPPIPSAPRALPVLGNLVPLAVNPLRFFASLASHGPLVKVRVGPVSLIVVCDPELTREFLVHDRLYDKGGPFFERGKNLIGDGLVTCPHREHRRLRRLVQPAFHQQHLGRYAEVMVRETGQITSRWHEAQSLDVLAEMKKITSAVLISTMFSGAVPGPVIQQMNEDLAVLVAGYFRWVVLPDLAYRMLPGSRAYLRILARLRRTVENIVADLRGRQHELSGDSLVAALLSARNEDGTGLSDREIADQVATFFVTGTETTAITLAWAIHFTAQCPELEGRLHAEVDRVLSGRPATYQDLPRLELTGRIIAEALRLYPPAWLFTRVAAADATLGDYAIPAGTTLAYSPFLIQRRPDLFPDPGRFDPDRWLPSRAAALPRHADVSFGGGARKCIADAFAATEASLALATIAASWRLLPEPGARVRPWVTALLQPKGLRMHPRPRTTEWASGAAGQDPRARGDSRDPGCLPAGGDGGAS
jgi:cytochrome P450